MKEERKQIVLAELEGYQLKELKQNGVRYPYQQNGEGRNTLPDYNSHDTLQRIIDGLGLSSGIKYDRELKDICNRDRTYVRNATPTQKQEAIIKATGRWEG